MSLRIALTAAAFSEAERIVFAAEGLLLAHDFLFNCGIRDQWRAHRVLSKSHSRQGFFLLVQKVDFSAGLLDSFQWHGDCPTKNWPTRFSAAMKQGAKNENSSEMPDSNDRG